MLQILTILLTAHLVFAGANTKPKPNEPQFDWEKYIKTYPRSGRDFLEKRTDKFGWKFSLDEWELMKQGRCNMLKYYKDPDHGSNGGYEVA